MSPKKLKVLLVFLIIVICILFLVSRTLTPKNSNDLKNNEEPVIVGTHDLEAIKKSEDIDYNNLTHEQMEYFTEIYGDTAGYTDEGIKVYLEKAFSGKPQKIITSRWPDVPIASVCKEPNFGKLQKIEYSDTKIEIFIEDAKASNLTSYLKEFKKDGFKQKEKQDGAVFTEYLYEKDNEYSLRGRYFKDEKRIEILLESIEK